MTISNWKISKVEGLGETWRVRASYASAGGENAIRQFFNSLFSGNERNYLSLNSKDYLFSKFEVKSSTEVDLFVFRDKLDYSDFPCFMSWSTWNLGIDNLWTASSPDDNISIGTGAEIVETAFQLAGAPTWTLGTRGFTGETETVSSFYIRDNSGGSYSDTTKERAALNLFVKGGHVKINRKQYNIASTASNFYQGEAQISVEKIFAGEVIDPITLDPIGILEYFLPVPENVFPHVFEIQNIPTGNLRIFYDFKSIRSNTKYPTHLESIEPGPKLHSGEIVGNAQEFVGFNLNNYELGASGTGFFRSGLIGWPATCDPEVSALTYNPLEDSLFIKDYPNNEVAPEPTRPPFITERGSNGQYKRTITTDIVDVEGFCHMSGRNFAIAAMHGPDKIYYGPIYKTSDTFNSTRLESIDIDIEDGGDSSRGIRGVAFDIKNNCFYVAKDRDNLAGDFASKGIYKIEFDGTTDHLFDSPDITNFAGLHYDSSLENFIIVSSEDRVIYHTDYEGNILSQRPIEFTHPDAITFTSGLKRMYVAGKKVAGGYWKQNFSGLGCFDREKYVTIKNPEDLFSRKWTMMFACTRKDGQPATLFSNFGGYTKPPLNQLSPIFPNYSGFAIGINSANTIYLQAYGLEGRMEKVNPDGAAAAQDPTIQEMDARLWPKDCSFFPDQAINVEGGNSPSNELTQAKFQCSRCGRSSDLNNVCFIDDNVIAPRILTFSNINANKNIYMARVDIDAKKIDLGRYDLYRKGFDIESFRITSDPAPGMSERDWQNPFFHSISNPSNFWYLGTGEALYTENYSYDGCMDYFMYLTGTLADAQANTIASGMFMQLTGVPQIHRTTPGEVTGYEKSITGVTGLLGYESRLSGTREFTYEGVAITGTGLIGDVTTTGYGNLYIIGDKFTGIYINPDTHPPGRSTYVHKRDYTGFYDLSHAFPQDFNQLYIFSGQNIPVITGYQRGESGYFYTGYENVYTGGPVTGYLNSGYKFDPITGDPFVQIIRPSGVTLAPSKKVYNYLYDACSFINQRFNHSEQMDTVEITHRHWKRDLHLDKHFSIGWAKNYSQRSNEVFSPMLARIAFKVPAINIYDWRNKPDYTQSGRLNFYLNGVAQHQGYSKVLSSPVNWQGQSTLACVSGDYSLVPDEDTPGRVSNTQDIINDYAIEDVASSRFFLRGTQPSLNSLENPDISQVIANQSVLRRMGGGLAPNNTTDMDHGYVDLNQTGMRQRTGIHSLNAWSEPIGITGRNAQVFLNGIKLYSGRDYTVTADGYISPVSPIDEITGYLSTFPAYDSKDFIVSTGYNKYDITGDFLGPSIYYLNGVRMPTSNFIYYASGVCLITGVDHIAGGPLKNLIWTMNSFWSRGVGPPDVDEDGGIRN